MSKQRSELERARLLREGLTLLRRAGKLLDEIEQRLDQRLSSRKVA